MANSPTPLDLFDDPEPSSRRPISRALMSDHQILAATPDSFLVAVNEAIDTSDTKHPRKSELIQPRRSNLHVWTHIFVPTFQTILSLVLFTRVPIMIGQIGILQTVLVALCATLLTLVTAVSVSVAGSGSWKRLFGTGFLALSSFLHPFSPKIKNSTFHHISVISAVCFVCTVGGLMGVFAGIFKHVAVAEGGIPVKNFLDNWAPLEASDYNMFFGTLGVFFPLVTGVLAGSSRSAELSNPRRDIPKYTILAQVITSVIYFMVIIVLGFAFDRTTLLSNSLPTSSLNVMVAIAWPNQWVSVIGCVTIALGAAIQGFTSAIKLLKAIASDEVLPILKMFKRNDSSPAAKLISKLHGRVWGFLIAEFVLLAVPQDYIFKFVTVVYLTCYLFVNAAAAVLSLIESPTWNPSWKYHHWSMSALASATSLVFACFISLPLALLVLVSLLLLIKVVSYYDARAQHGVRNSEATGILLQIAKRNLWEVEWKNGERQHLKQSDWRPSIMLFVDVVDDGDGWRVIENQGIEFLSQLNKSGGLAVICTVRKGKPEMLPQTFKAHSIKACLLEEAQKYHINAFPQVIVANTFRSGLFSGIQGSGIGPLRSNTVMLNWPKEMTLDFTDVLRGIILLDKSVILVKRIAKIAEPENLSETVDIYWILLDGGILTLMAHILLRNREWRNCKLRIFVIADETDDCESMKANLLTTLKGLRINAIAEVLSMKTCDGKTFGVLDDSDSNNADVAVIEERRQSSMSLWSVADFRKSLATSRDTVVDFEAKVETPSTDTHEIRLKFLLTLNSAIRDLSSRSRLVITNLPSPGVAREMNDENAKRNYLECLKAMAQEIPNIMLIKGTGSEVVTDFY
ncbi:UNVERIFIED_CONTAM: hypothetical protein HDU68_000832 [Siphonaria sp. JEL0065]|nr:hypothetical protein HDU68_000832 [Siphonaria sp. JEL0065]